MLLERKMSDGATVKVFIEDVPALLASLRPMRGIAEDFGLSYSAVSYWRKKGYVPRKHTARMVTYLRRHGYMGMTADILRKLNERHPVPSGAERKYKLEELPVGGKIFIKASRQFAHIIMKRDRALGRIPPGAVYITRAGEEDGARGVYVHRHV